jgi:hypothetical protein
MPLADEIRKFDVHTCFAGMNIKFPGFSCEPRSGHTPIRQSGVKKGTGAGRQTSENRFTQKRPGENLQGVFDARQIL